MQMATLIQHENGCITVDEDYDIVMTQVISAEHYSETLAYIELHVNGKAIAINAKRALFIQEAE